MTAKKRWLSKIYPDSQDFPKNNLIDISWSSSDSDEERFVKKKVENAKNKWITSGLYQNKNVFLSEMESKIYQTSSNCCQSVAINVWNLNNASQKVIRVPDPSCEETSKINTSLHQCCESPVIKMKVEELSPVIKTRDDFDITNEGSPVIGNKRHVLKKIHFRYKTRRIDKQVDESSPDLFETQLTQLIESESPEMKNELSLIEPDTLLPTERIDPFPSQHSSQIINSNTESSSSVNNIPLYHQPAPRRKRYKKGGLASLLQKTLHLQKTRISIWHHEIYTKKTDNIINFEQGKVINFVVKNKWKEYGNILLECNSSDLLPSKHNSELPIRNNFLVIIGFSTSLNYTLSTNSQYKLFPPYSIKTVNYKLQQVTCYYNVSKLIPLLDL